MARRHRRTNADGLIDLVARFPWWVGLGIAVVGYLVLHAIATQPMPTGVKPGQVGALVTGSLIRALATAGQYVVPIIGVVAAIVSAARQRSARKLAETVVHSKAAAPLNDMTWQQFERLVSESFRRDGYTVLETGGGGADGGIDLVLRRRGETHLVQCKQWRAFKVGVEVVRELYGVMAARGAAGGFVVTSGRFTDEATAFAAGRNVQLLDGAALRQMLQRSRNADLDAPSTVPSFRGSTEADATASPACPACTGRMVKRTAKKGPRAGAQFWGCVRYPGCSGTRAVD